MQICIMDYAIDVRAFVQYARMADQRSEATS
jgi:hypothetical protein